MPTFTRNDYVRMFFASGGLGPANPPVYEGQAMIGEASWKQGDPKPVRMPSVSKLGVFDTIGEILGDQGLPDLKTTWRFTQSRSALLALIDQGCSADIQAHIGSCGDPRDFDGGWVSILCLEKGRITDYTTDKLMALEPQERAQILESAPFMGQDYYQIMPMNYAAQASAQDFNEVLDIRVSDTPACGDCGVSSDGCQTLFAVSTATIGSPGLPAEVYFSVNGGATWGTTHVTASALPANKNPDSMIIVGKNMIVIASSNANIAYAATQDIINGVDVWSSVTTGIVVSGEPKVAYSAGPNLTWFAGKGGYLYFSSDPTSGLTVQDAGVATTSDYAAINGIDENNIVAVGANNSMAFTANGGQTWSAVTGPNVGVALTAIAMRSQNEWWVGDAAGKVWYTINSGRTWTRKTVPHDGGAGNVKDIKFGFNGNRLTVGWIAINTGTKGYILRSVSGGSSWYTAPELGLTAPAALQFDKLATCSNINVIFGCGISAGTHGLIVKGA